MKNKKSESFLKTRKHSLKYYSEIPLLSFEATVLYAYIKGIKLDKVHEYDEKFVLISCSWSNTVKRSHYKLYYYDDEKPSCVVLSNFNRNLCQLPTTYCPTPRYYFVIPFSDNEVSYILDQTTRDVYFRCVRVKTYLENLALKELPDLLLLEEFLDPTSKIEKHKYNHK